MISVTGYGLFLVLLIYVGGLSCVSQLFADASRMTQILSIVCTGVVATVLNYLLARRLNRNGVKHAVWEVRLEYVVLVLGGVLILLALMMLMGEFKTYN